MSPSKGISGVLFAEAAKLRHAVIRDVVITCEGKVEAEHEYHYLTCKRCKLEKRAWEINQLEQATTPYPNAESTRPALASDPLRPDN